MTRPERIERIMLEVLANRPRSHFLPVAPGASELEHAFAYATAIVQFVDKKHPAVYFVDIPADLPDLPEGDR